MTNSGTASVRGTANDTVVNEAGGTLNLTGNLAGNNTVTNNGLFNSGNGFTMTGFTSFTNAASGTFALDGTLNLGGATPFTNAGTFNAAGTRSLSGVTDFANSGTMNVNGLMDLTASNSFSNTGRLNILGGMTVTAPTVSNTGTIDLNDGDTTDTLTINGNLTQASGNYIVDVDLSGGQPPSADTIIVNGNMSGTGFVQFVDAGDGTRGLFQGNQLVLFDVRDVGGVASTNTSTLTFAGLPQTDELIQYILTKSADQQDWIVTSTVNPEAGSIAGSISLINSLIGTVVNRPSSPFVGGVAYEPESICGLGPWSRATGGGANVTGTTTNGFATRESEVSVYYGGWQAGGDVQCLSVGDSGWDLAVGAYGGFNVGRSSQSIGSLTTDIAFDQYYGGGYVAAAKGAFAAELQARFDYIGYTLDNTRLSLVDYDADSLVTSVLGSASYTFTAGDYIIVPGAGFRVSQAQTDTISFNNGQSLEFDDDIDFLALAGVTVARSFISEDQTSAYRPFATATVYTDFGAEAESLFTQEAAGTTPSVQQGLSSQGIGTFGEVSVGLDYLKVLPENDFKAGQINATIRGDLKFSDRLLSAGGTMQFRVQF